MIARCRLCGQILISPADASLTSDERAMREYLDLCRQARRHVSQDHNELVAGLSIPADMCSLYCASRVLDGNEDLAEQQELLLEAVRDLASCLQVVATRGDATAHIV